VEEEKSLREERRKNKKSPPAREEGDAGATQRKETAKYILGGRGAGYPVRKRGKTANRFQDKTEIGEACEGRFVEGDDFFANPKKKERKE